MINSKAVVKGGSVYISDLDSTVTKDELIELSYKDFKMICSFMDEKELQRCQTLVESSNIKSIYVSNIFSTL